MACIIVYRIKHVVVNPPGALSNAAADGLDAAYDGDLEKATGRWSTMRLHLIFLLLAQEL